jgi:adenylate cyclase
MGIEIERKFLVKKDLLKLPELDEINIDKPILKVAQGYLSTDPERTVRIRLSKLYEATNIMSHVHHFSFIAIKGKNTGCSCPEYEYKVPREEAKEIFKLCKHKIFKTRYQLPVKDNFLRNWEIDVFHGDNEGLIIAELEVLNEDEYNEIKLPDWIDKDVTGDNRYYNSNLAINPYKTWTNK